MFDAAKSVNFDTSGLSEFLGVCGQFQFELVPAVGEHEALLTLPDPLLNTLTVEAASPSQVGVYSGLQIKASLVSYPSASTAFSDPFTLTVVDPTMTVVDSQVETIFFNN